MSARPEIQRSRYFGVFLLENDAYTSEVVHDFSVHNTGIFTTEHEAAVAYDELAFSLKGAQALLNFRRDDPDSLTVEAASLAANVAYENLMNAKRHRKFAESIAGLVAAPLKKIETLDDAISLDSLDSDSEVESDHEPEQDAELIANANGSDSDEENESDIADDLKAERIKY